MAGTRRSISHVRDCVRSLDYAVSLHAAEELDDDELTILDLETLLLTGTIIARQRDTGTRESKLVIQGRTSDDRPAEAVVKFNQSGTLFVITVYLA